MENLGKATIKFVGSKDINYGYIYKSETAFRKYHNAVCYISEHAFERLGEPIEKGGNIVVAYNSLSDLIEYHEIWTYETLYDIVHNWGNSLLEKIDIGDSLSHKFICEMTEYVFENLKYECPFALLEEMNPQEFYSQYMRKNLS